MNRITKVLWITKILLLILFIPSSPLFTQSIFDKAENWLLDKNFFVNYGPQFAWYKVSHVEFVQEEYQRNIVFEKVKARDNARLASFTNGQFLCSQFRLNVGVDLSKKYTLLIVGTHLTYIVRTGETYYRNGRWDGERVSDDIVFSDYFRQLEHSNGINTWNLGLRRNFSIAGNQNERFKISFSVMPQIGGIFTATQAEVKNPNGVFERYDPGNSLSGFTYALDFSTHFLLFRHMTLDVNFNYFQMYIKRARLSKDSYVNQDLIGYNYGFALGYKF